MPAPSAGAPTQPQPAPAIDAAPPSDAAAPDPPADAEAATATEAAPAPAPEAEPRAAPALSPPPPGAGSALRAARWSDVEGWKHDEPAAALPAFLAGCRTLGRRPAWREVCAEAGALRARDRRSVRAFFEKRFVPHRVVNADGSRTGLVTGYYEPLLRGSRSPSPRYPHPLFGPPDDLLVVEMGDLYPELKGLKLRGRLDGRRVVPYYSRGEIEAGKAPVDGRAFLWVDDPIDLFFLQVQGSGRVRLDSGETVRVGYAEHNGHPYRSIGRHLIDTGEIAPERASMQGIKAWARSHPDRLAAVLQHNARYVFFRELPPSPGGPPGSLGVPLTAERSIAVDPQFVPLGAPVFLATTEPNAKRPLHRLVMAQDTGGAIKGAVRADFFWGFGDGAGALAGRMKQSGRMWVLVPAGVAPAELFRR